MPEANTGALGSQDREPAIIRPPVLKGIGHASENPFVRPVMESQKLAMPHTGDGLSRQASNRPAYSIVFRLSPGGRWRA